MNAWSSRIGPDPHAWWKRTMGNIAALMPMGERMLARACGVSVARLRYWEQTGRFPQNVTTLAGKLEAAGLPRSYEGATLTIALECAREQARRASVQQKATQRLAVREQRDAVPRKCERCKKLTRYRTRMGDPICEVCA